MTITLSAMLKKLVALAIFSLLSIPPVQALHSLDKYVSAKQLASPGLLVVNSTDRSVLAQNKSDTPRIPASVLKLLSTTAALYFIGPDKQYSTKIYKTAEADTFYIKGTLDPWLTSNLSFAKKNKQRFLPGLVSKANTENRKKLKIVYAGLFEKDTTELAANLKKKGIKLSFQKISSAEAEELGIEELASVTSVPVSEMVKFVTLWSDNRLADRLAKDAAREIGFETDGKGLTTTFKLALDALGVDHTGLVVKDGSGLSKENRVSATTIVNLLMTIRNNPTYAAIYEGLPVGGKTGTLQKRFLETAPDAVGKVRAKTGWVNNSVTLAGYVQNGETEYAFAILADGITPSFTARNKARAAMDRFLGVIVKGNH
jgi:D-alanyl-D-alanine carboxypeptidase